jgi:hypothetical protein
VTPAALTWSGVTARHMARNALAEPATKVGPVSIAGVPRHWWVPSRARRTLHLAGAVRTRVGLRHAISTVLGSLSVATGYQGVRRRG